MSGTDATKPAVQGGGPAVILIDPQLGENIGTAARAMLNCGLVDLRLVRPRDGWPNDKARSASSGADPVIDGARVFDRTEDAVADLARVFATTARPRDMVKPVVTPREAAAIICEAGAGQPSDGGACGVLFGPERSGLTNDDIALADTIVTIPLNPAFMSLNLAQAVLLVGYEWFTARDAATFGGAQAGTATEPADKAHLIGLFEHLEQELDAAEFFRVAEKRPSMVRNIRNLIQRALPTEHEVRTLHGIVTSLSGRRLGGRPRRRADAQPDTADG